jgi:hypothetical protein
MSLYNQTVSNTPLSLDGLINGSFNDITINGFPFDPKNVVPYTGALKSVDLNGKQLTNASLVSASSMITNTLRITTVPTGTATKSLAVDVSGNVIQGSLVPTEITVQTITPGYASPLYFSYLVTNSAGDRVLYVDTVDPITYNTNSKTLSVKNLSATSGTWTNTGTTNSQTLLCGSFTASSGATFPQFCTFSTAPSVGVPALFLALDALNQVVTTAGISAQPTITATNTNATFYLTFAPNATTTATSPLYVDAGASLTYNAFSNTLTVPNASIDNVTVNSTFIANGTNTIYGYAPLNSPALTGIPTAPTAFPGSNTDQIATCQYVQDALPNLTGYALLASPTFTGIPTAPTAPAGTNTNQLATTQYVTTAVSGLSGFITKTGTNTGINTILRLNGTSSEFVVQSSTSNPLLSVRQSASPYVSADSLYIINTLETQGTTTLQGATTINNTLSVSGNTTVGGNLVVTNALTATTGSVEVGSNVILMRNVNYPHLFLGAGVTAGNYIGQATGPTNFINDATTGDLCIDSRTGNIRLAGGAQYARTNLLITDDTNTSFRPLTIASDNARLLRLCYPNTSSGYGVIHYNDGGAYYILLTPNGTPLAEFNGLRPFYIDLNSGRLNSNNGQTFSGGTEFAISGTTMVTINTVGLNLATAGYLTNYQGATNAGLSNVSNGDLIMYGNGSTQTLRFFTGANLRAYANNSRVEVLGVEHTVFSSSYGQYRMISNSFGYGAFWRNDNANFYFLKTANGDPYGVWDGTRPLRIELSTGKMFSENGYQALGGLSCDSFTAGVNNGSHVALNGGNGFYMVGSGNQPTGCYLPAGFNLYKVYISTTGNQFGTNDQWWGEAIVRYNNNAYNGSVTTTASNNVQVSCDANGQIYCYCPGGGGLFYAWITWQRVI